MTLKDFPRGGKKTITKTPSNFLFDKKEKTKNKKTKHKKAEDKLLCEVEPIASNTAQCLTYSTLIEGIIILGRVQTSTEFDISISLPGRLKGYLALTDISPAYTSILQNLIDGENNHPPEFKPLNELYKRGDYLVCYVKHMNLDEKRQITLSIEPDLINQNLDPTKLQKGSKIACTISSIEDHGYVVDTGIKVFRGFLSNSDIENNVRYYPGQQIFCTIKSIKSTENVTTVKLSSKSKYTSIVTVDNQSLDAMVPGVLMQLNIKRILSNGLQVTFNDNNIGYINQLHLSNPLKSYEQGTDIVGKLLYVLPTVKLAYFSELLLTEENNTTIKINEIIEKAKFLYRESNGIVLHLAKGIRGFISFKRTGIDFDAISSKFVANSLHKCRVIAYDIFDRVYICTMQRHLLKDTYISIENVKAGDIMTVEIVRINNNNGFIFVKSGNIHGDVSPEHVTDTASESKEIPQVGSKMKAKVLGSNKQGNGLLFTLKKSLIDSELPILSNFDDAKVGSKYHGTITQITKHGLLVVFYNNVKGWIPATKISKKTGGHLNYTIGQVVLAKIDKVFKDDSKILLSIVNNITEMNATVKYEIGDAVEGTVVDSSIEGVYIKIFDDNNSDSIIGFLPAGHMAPCLEIANYLSARYTPGDKLSALVFSISPVFLLTRTFVPQAKYTKFNKFQLGNVIPCSIKEIDSRKGLKVILPIKEWNNYGVVPLNKIDNIEFLHTHQILFGKITNINKKEKKMNLTTALIDVWNDAVEKEADMIGAVDQLTLYLSKLMELTNQTYYEGKTISKMRLGERVSGVVDKITEHGVVIKLNNNVTGTVRPVHYKGALTVGDKVKGTVIWIDYINELVEVTLLPILAHSISDKQSALPQSSLEIQLRGEVLLVTNWFVLVVLKGQGKGSLAVLPSRRHVNDIRPNLKSYTIGKKIRCYVVLNKNESELLPICLVKSAFESRKKVVLNEKKGIKRKIDSPKDGDDLLIKKLKKPINDKKKTQMNDKLKKSTKPNTNEKIEGKRKAMDKLKVEEETNKMNCGIENEKMKEISENLSIPECGFFWDTNPNTEFGGKKESLSESSDDEIDDELKQQQKKKKKLSSAEKREMERQKEKEIREKEEALISNQTPNSADQFDRLTLGNPDSSVIWIQYMAYHLQATEIDKARAVAKRALKNINYREENEKLNVWLAWLNLESRFGTIESLNNVLQQALNANESKKIYFHMLTVHADAGRHVELEKIIKSVTGKFKHLPEMWIEVGSALLKIGLKDKSRHIMQRALQSLPPRDHVNLIMKFAQLENKFGDKERAQTLFENILVSYPKRIDIWSSYVDSLVKSGDIDGARRILDKAIVQVLPPRKMRIIFKKFIAFEEQHGTPEGVTRVRELAVSYVEKQCSKEVN